MKVYHGSLHQVRNPDAKKGRSSTTITLYDAQVLTVAETVARLKVDEYFNQISFHSQAATNELIFSKAEKVTPPYSYNKNYQK
jgi:hypothetical protein